jgi:predicted RNA-binding Zn-ribbon protein involved in translation (DUF1610 family)
MSLPLLIHGLGSIGIFASRAFLPAFATALLLRFGPQVPWLAQAGLLPHVRDVPTWFTSDTSLIVLGVLSVLELVAERIPEVKTVLDEIHGYLKTGMAVLTFLGVLGASDRALVGGVVGNLGPVEYLPALAVGAGTFLASKARGLVVGPLSEADEDDDLGVQSLLRWVEDVWSALGPVALILLPLLTLAGFGAALIVLLLAGRFVAAREEATRVPCPNCGQLIYASATICPRCKAPNKEPMAVGLLGGTRNVLADPAAHPYRLAAARRCPLCATRLGKRAVHQACEGCGSAVLDDPAFASQYIAFIDRRVPLVCLACFLLGLVPVLGVIPAVILYRLEIVAPFRRYIPPGRSFVLRWGIRLASLVLVAFQWVPLLGGLLLPAMAMINYWAYRDAFRKLASGA